MNARSEAPTEKNLPISAKVGVAEVLLSRYGGAASASCSGVQGVSRPTSWDQRLEGIDVIRAVGGETVKLKSSAMQSTPKPGWIIVLTGGTEHDGYSWTLYGITPSH
jgi:hypothetical protein